MDVRHQIFVIVLLECVIACVAFKSTFSSTPNLKNGKYKVTPFMGLFAGGKSSNRVGRLENWKKSAKITIASLGIIGGTLGSPMMIHPVSFLS